ncbi:hypothetical protein LY90DRAFT_518189 [Neocallimastix californiae]|uniref:Uncharacterized protein n=1 Tax=Neocallimastix californiae TaxID=1754190 RepID=A0A1Y1ZU83_9FUNG|nr:hypothetical protein LY90DRAFT_518189 [Neocallimastix californiae]|eukprot:ORY13335.1 hypothetical protein LY90DRAFT_518189 [Neocallimastix californiae]
MKFLLDFFDSTDCSSENIINININKKTEDGNYPLLIAIDKNDTKEVEKIMNYANENGIILNINEKNNKGMYPLLKAVMNNNIEITNLIINYAIKNDIILEINDYSNQVNLLQLRMPSSIKMMKL